MRSNLYKISRPFTTSTQRLPSFPRTLSELETSVKTCLSINDELNSTGINEPEYFKRRQEVIETSAKYQIDEQTIPAIEYTLDERRLWYRVYRELATIQERGAPQKIFQKFIQLEKGVDMAPRKIPQLQDISKYHFQNYGWRLRPVFGLLTLQEFLNQLAFQIWPATQFVRHRSGSLYNPEPDFIHEVFGHQAMLGLPQCRNSLYKIGLASLGASQENLEKLAAAYWYTFEVGLCLEDDSKSRKILGGAVLSSIEESSIALGSKAKIIDFDLKVITNKKYRSEIQYTGIQPFYVLSPPIDELCIILDNWVDKILEEKSFIPSFNPQTRQIEVTIR